MDEVIYWERIKEAGFCKGFFGTWLIILFKPKLFWACLKSSQKFLPPFLFAWLNMFLSALFLTFIYGPKVGYMRPQGLYEILSGIGFMIIIIPVIFISPLFLASLFIHWGLVSNKVKSNVRLIFRLICYSFSAVFLIFEIGVPLSRYPFSFAFVSVWLITTLLFALKNIFEISIGKAINSSAFLIVVLTLLSIFSFWINNRFLVERPSIFLKIFIIPSYVFLYVFSSYKSVKEGWDFTGGM